MPSPVKRLARWAATRPALLPLYERLWPHQATILMLHRFESHSMRVSGHSPEALNRDLAWLREHGYRFLSLSALVEALQEGAPLEPRSVVFTVDDGYRDFAETGAEVFARHDCPVTVFLTTGFLDGLCWFWWDQIDHALRQTSQATFAGELAGRPVGLAWGSPPARSAAVAEATRVLLHIPEPRRTAALGELFASLGVTVPITPPPEYAPMTWSQVRALASQGVSFGPHTVTHPNLATCAEETASEEIAQSWDRVRTETEAVVPVFCYPFGGSATFGARERGIVRRLGLRAAVSAIHGHASNDRPGAAIGDRILALPRWGYDDQMGTSYLAATVSGLEAIKAVLRHEEVYRPA